MPDTVQNAIETRIKMPPTTAFDSDDAPIDAAYWLVSIAPQTVTTAQYLVPYSHTIMPINSAPHATVPTPKISYIPSDFTLLEEAISNTAEAACKH